MGQYRVRAHHRTQGAYAGVVEAKRIENSERLIAISVWLDAFGVPNTIELGHDGPTAISLTSPGFPETAGIGDWVVRSGAFWDTCSDAHFHDYYEPLEGS